MQLSVDEHSINFQGLLTLTGLDELLKLGDKIQWLCCSGAFQAYSLI